MRVFAVAAIASIAQAFIEGMSVDYLSPAMFDEYTFDMWTSDLAMIDEDGVLDEGELAHAQAQWDILYE